MGGKIKESITIWVMTEDLITGEQFTEKWSLYHPEFTEEHAIIEIWEVMDRWNNNLRRGDNPRQALSFVLEVVEVGQYVPLHDIE